MLTKLPQRRTREYAAPDIQPGITQTCVKAVRQTSLLHTEHNPDFHCLPVCSALRNDAEESRSDQFAQQNPHSQRLLLFFCCFLTLLTDPLRIQPWSQDRRNQTKSNRESEISMESRQKRTDKEVASKGHRRDKIENINQKHTDSRNKLEPTA